MLVLEVTVSKIAIVAKLWVWISDQWQAEVMESSTELDEVQRNEKKLLSMLCETQLF